MRLVEISQLLLRGSSNESSWEHFDFHHSHSFPPQSRAHPLYPNLLKVEGEIINRFHGERFLMRVWDVEARLRKISLALIKRGCYYYYTGTTDWFTLYCGVPDSCLSGKSERLTCQCREFDPRQCRHVLRSSVAEITINCSWKSTWNPISLLLFILFASELVYIYTATLIRA